MDIDTSYARARKLAIGNSKELNLILVGCGGTGSWLAPSVVRAAKVLTEKISVKVNVTFIDPDLVEEKNVYRQNFCLAEIGANKAETLALLGACLSPSMRWSWNSPAHGKRSKAKVMAMP
jgi:tRNA A37 threonylcarbamoyladenosine dehydratase